MRKAVLFFVLNYLAVSVLQFFAGIDGIMHFFGLHWIFAGFAALLLLFAPALGPLASVYGAVFVWKWPVLVALLLFFWPYILYALLLSFGVRFSWKLWKFGKSAKTRQEKMSPQDIEATFTVKETKDI